MRDRFYTQRGYLTLYSLMCGYLDVNEGYNEPSQRYRVSLGHEGAVFHVQGYDHHKHERVTWECFDTLPEARRHFMQTLKNLGLRRKINRPGSIAA